MQVFLHMYFPFQGPHFGRRVLKLNVETWIVPDVAVTIAAESQGGRVIGAGELLKAMSAVMHKNHKYITGNKETHSEQKRHWTWAWKSL